MKIRNYKLLVRALNFIVFLALIIGCGSRWRGPEYVATDPVSSEVPEGTLAIAIKEERFATVEFRPKTHSLPAVTDFAEKEYQEYTLGHQDRLNIRIWVGDEFIVNELFVDINGDVMVPYGGRVFVEGMTVMEARDAITAKLKRVFREPIVDIVVKDHMSKKLFLLGEGAPDIISFVPLTKRATIFEYLYLFKAPLVDVDGITLRRGDEIYPLNIRALNQGDLNYNVELMHKDILYIPSYKNSFVTIAGEVGAPKLVEYHPGMSLFEAIIRGGGLTQYARVSEIRIIRGGLYNPVLLTIDLKPFFRSKHPSLNEEEFARLWMSYDASRSSHKSLEKLILQKNDFVYIPRTWIGSWNNFMSILQPTLASILATPIQVFSQVVYLDRALGDQ